jgi:hypothetical protein
MILYWILFGLCAGLAILSGSGGSGPNGRRRASTLGLITMGVAIAVMIGLRFKVGGDWNNYVGHFHHAGFMQLGTILTQPDPGYYSLNWLAHAIGVGIWAVNLVCAAIFTWGLIAFSRSLPQPWLALVVAVPYLIIVVAMGYTRQGVAIGFVMLGLVALQRNSVIKFVIWVAFAVTFHKTAVIVLPLVALSRVRNRVPTFFLLAALGYMLYHLFLNPEMDELVSAYVDAEYNSQGALVRVAMTVFPAIIFLLNRRRFHVPEDQAKLWRNFSFAALICLPALYLLPSSTVVDRLALYLIPLQLFVFAWLPRAFQSGRHSNSQLMLGVILYSAAVQFVWLDYADNAKAWIPYQFYPLAAPPQGV